MSSEEVVILSAVRTPIGAFCGKLSKVPAHELGAAAIREAITRAAVTPEDISEVIFGHVLTAGQGQNTARQAAIAAGLPITVPATCINMVCGSGLRTVMLAAQAIKSGDAKFVLAGGQESMSLSHHSANLRGGIKMGTGALVDTMVHDGLTDAFQNVHMGITAENIAKQWGISRDQQDEFALKSQLKTAKAQEEGLFDAEIVPITISGRHPTIVSKDEHPRNDTTKEALQKLRPVFIHDGTGTVTAGNASGLNDGAVAIVVSSKSAALEKGLKPMAKIVAYATAGVDPSIMGIGPVPAVRKALEIANWTVEEVDFYELNEAFASQSLAVANDLNISADKINVNGGAIALGHPIGASGARVLVTLLYILKHHQKKKGVAALCIGGGMGIAICVELVDDQ